MTTIHIPFDMGREFGTWCTQHFGQDAAKLSILRSTKYGSQHGLIYHVKFKVVSDVERFWQLLNMEGGDVRTLVIVDKDGSKETQRFDPTRFGSSRMEDRMACYMVGASLIGGDHILVDGARWQRVTTVEDPFPWLEANMGREGVTWLGLRAGMLDVPKVAFLSRDEDVALFMLRFPATVV